MVTVAAVNRRKWLFLLMWEPARFDNGIVEMVTYVPALANEELKLPALASEAAGSLRSPAALLLVRRGLTPARLPADYVTRRMRLRLRK